MCEILNFAGNYFNNSSASPVPQTPCGFCPYPKPSAAYVKVIGTDTRVDRIGLSRTVSEIKGDIWKIFSPRAFNASAEGFPWNFVNVARQKRE